MTSEDLDFPHIIVNDPDAEPDDHLYNMSDDQFEAHLEMLHNAKVNGLI